MKLEHYEPTYRWVLLQPIYEEKTAGGIFIPTQSVKASAYLVIKTGPQCEAVKPGQRVIVENGHMLDLTFEGKRDIYYQVLEPRIVGIDNDSTRATHQGESALSGDSEQ